MLPSGVPPAPAPPGSSVWVSGVPPGLPAPLLALYFENRRRSGGGPLRGCRRRGARARLTFLCPQDAQRVLSRAEHVLQGARLTVQPAAPRDYKKVVLQGLNPQSSRELVELYVEHMLKCERGDFSLYRSPAGDQALVQLQRPLSHAEFLALAEQVRSRPLDKAPLDLDWLEQTDSLLVQSCNGEQLQQDLLELYFESKRSGGGPLQAVRLLPGATTAVISFQDRAVAERVLQRPHQLPNGSLDICPHYDFLEPTEKEAEEDVVQEKGRGESGALPEDKETPPLTYVPLPEEAWQRLLQSSLVLQELGAPVPECSLHLDGARLCISGGDPAGRAQLEAHVQAALRAAVQERLAFSTWMLAFLRREDIQQSLAERLAEQRVGACYLPPGESGVVVVALTAPSARLAASLLRSTLSPISLPLSERHLLALASPSWDRVQAGLRHCLVRLAEGGDRLEGLTLAGLEQENVGRLEAFLRDSVPDETLVAMEAGQLRFLQLYHQEVLANMAAVTSLPLEGEDITGLRLYGEAQACQAAADLLQSLLSAIHTQTVVLQQLPGVNRFLLEERGRAIVQALEPCFRCVIGLERLHWTPLEAQHELEMSQEPLVLNCQRDSPHGSQWPGGPGSAAHEQSEANMVEIKGILAALQPPSAAAAAPEPEEGGRAEGGSEPAGAEEDLYTEPELPGTAGNPSTEEEEEQQQEAAPAEEVEEEAQLLLAIQQSMESTRREEDEIRRATELSLLSWQREQEPSPDALLSAMSISLEAGNSAQLVVCAESEAAVEQVVQELEAALRAQLRKEEVTHEALRSLPAFCLDYLVHLERKHAVRISLVDSVATVCGFLDYPVAATRDLALLLARFLQTEPPRGSREARWVRWENSGQGSPSPYSTQASALLEQAWRRGHRRVDVFFEGRPFTFDFERMEEYDLGNARTLPIGRTEPSSVVAPDPLGPPALAEEEVRLVPLVQSSQEFWETVRHFYSTLEDFHNQIRIVKVEKLMHPLLYRQYQLKKVAMEKACGHQQVERVLYHGTTEQSSHEICQHGFNRSFCGRNATSYGHGVYFAKEAFLSAHDQYSPCSSNGNKYIFVARTLVGDYTVGRQDMRAPPLREGDATLRRYDSTVDNDLDPSIFVIFNDTQAYPQYLITCQWSKLR